MSKYVFEMYGGKDKGYSSMKYQKFHGSTSQKLSCIDQKYEKWEPNEKFSIKCKHFDEESYMLISTNEIGRLTLC